MVRYAVGPSTEVGAHREAQPAAVWPLLFVFDAPGSFSYRFERAERIGDGPALDATSRSHDRRPALGAWAETVRRTINGIAPVERASS